MPPRKPVPVQYDQLPLFEAEGGVMESLGAVDPTALVVTPEVATSEQTVKAAPNGSGIDFGDQTHRERLADEREDQGWGGRENDRRDYGPSRDRASAAMLSQTARVEAVPVPPVPTEPKIATPISDRDKALNSRDTSLNKASREQRAANDRRAQKRSGNPRGGRSRS